MPDSEWWSSVAEARPKPRSYSQIVYEGSDGAITKRYYADLAKHGGIGVIAINLFRAQKSSARAKVYRGGIRGQGSYRGMAYDKKAWSLAQLCTTLQQSASECGAEYGWKRDPASPMVPWVLYVDLPEGFGQVSFHALERGPGPDYPGEWDGKRASAERICAFCDSVLRYGSELA